MTRVPVFLVMLLLLAGCMPFQAGQVSVATLPNPLSPPESGINSVESTSTLPPAPTKTVVPTRTLLSVLSVTEMALSNVQNDYIVPGEEPDLSPDGKWRAFTDNGFEVAHLILTSIDGKKSWDLTFQDITGGSSCISYTDQYGDNRCFYGVLHINHWYKNGRYVFVDADYSIDRSTNFSYGLYRIDSETGNVSPYLPLNGYTYNHAFSPDDEHYAYATGSDNYLLHVVSIETGENISYVVPGRYEDLGEMLWSPDNKKLAIVTSGIGWSLVLLDLETGKFSTLIKEEGYRLTPLQWLNEDTLLLYGRDKNGQDYHDYQLTISTNTLLPLPETRPTP